MRQILDRYEGRLADPALRPAGASPGGVDDLRDPVPELAADSPPTIRRQPHGGARPTAQQTGPRAHRH